MRPDRSCLAATLLALVCSSQAQAHGALPGSDGFYAGLAHMSQDPALLIALMATVFALLPDWPHRFRAGYVVFVGAVIVGLLAGRSLAALLPLDLALLTAAMLTAAIAALAGDRGSRAMPPFFAAVGLLIGAACLPDPADPMDVLVTAAGGASLALVAPLALGGGYDALPARFRGPGLAIALRVAAAWTCAVAAMLAALLLRAA